MSWPLRLEPCFIVVDDDGTSYFVSAIIQWLEPARFSGQLGVVGGQLGMVGGQLGMVGGAIF